MRNHQASVLSCREYCTEVRLLVGHVDRHDYGPVRERVCEIIGQLRSEWSLADHKGFRYEDGCGEEVPIQTWPLWKHGEGSLVSEDRIRRGSIPSVTDLRLWFMVVLARYLEPCPSIGGNASVLDAALVAQGWNRPDRDLLFKGHPLSELLKPGMKAEPTRTTAYAYEDWLWQGPSRARSSGWLSVDEIRDLHRRLHNEGDRICAYDVTQIEGIRADNPIVIRDYKQYLGAGYGDALAMLSIAKHLGQCLFMSIT